MIIFVKTLSGKTVTLDVSETDTISVIKDKIADRENVPASQQRIVFAGKDLDDAKQLVECGIKKESIIHLILKASQKNLSSYTATQQAELEVAQTKTTKYYNESCGLQDELSTYRDSESKFDSHAYRNPQGSEYDLGKDGEFKEFVVLIGHFVPATMTSPVEALRRKGFKVFVTNNEKDFITNLPNADVAWFLSGTKAGAAGECYPGYKTVSRDEFIEAVLTFHKRGGGLFVWGDNEPLFEHANAVLPAILGENVELIGNTPAAKKLVLGNGEKTGQFSPHIIFTGVINLYEGVTICYPNKLGCMKVLATSTDNNPVICYADNEALKSDTVGRLVVDCGYTKNYISWDSAGSARWLLGLEHKILHELPIEGKNKNNDAVFTESDKTNNNNNINNINYNNNYNNNSTNTSTTTTTAVTQNISNMSLSSSSNVQQQDNKPKRKSWFPWRS